MVRCHNSGEISLVKDGKRHQFSAEVYQAFGLPAVSVNETGACPLILSCPLGEPVAAPANVAAAEA